MPLSFEGAFVGGGWTGNGSGSLSAIEVVNPATATVCGSVSACGAAEAQAALSSAKDGSAVWATLSLDARAKHINAYKEALLARKDDIVSILVQETGKVTGNAEYDFTMLIDCLGYHIEEARRSYTTVFPSPDDGSFSYTRNVPVGVVVCILTWNFPLLNLGYKLGPILASGCTAVIKPSENTPLATSLCIDILKDCDFPAGVVNLVNGTGLDLVEPLCASKVPRLLTCIGSTVMGRRIMQYGATSIKRYSLELGGDAPVLVFADADLDAAVADIVGLKFANGGQICVSPNRVLVQAEVYDAFLAKAAGLAARYAYGSGDDHAPKDEVLQPVVSEEALQRLLALVQDATAQGARLVCGGGREERDGFFLQPTILADVNKGMRCQSSEIFGPILACRQFSTPDEAFSEANDSEVGLSGYVYTGSMDTALRAESELECGNVLINGAHYSIELPHGGLKQSGYGKDISHLCLRDYYDVKRVTMKRKARA